MITKVVLLTIGGAATLAAIAFAALVAAGESAASLPSADIVAIIVCVIGLFGGSYGFMLNKLMKHGEDIVEIRGDVRAIKNGLGIND